MWWLIIAAPAALVAYELLDEDRRAVWAKRWGRRWRLGGSVPVLSPEEKLDTSELHGLLDDAKQGLDRRNGGGKIGLSVRRSGLDTSEWRDLLARAREVEPCYTCELLNREAAGPHEHPFEDLVAAESAERGLRHPRRSKALWQLVNRARGHAGKTPAPKPISGSRRW